jgi:hypothetical protein
MLIVLSNAPICNLIQRTEHDPSRPCRPRVHGTSAEHSADPAEIAKAYTLFDDCLGKAVTKQPKGRPVEPLLRDLFSDCSVELTRIDDLLQRSRKTKEQAHDDIYYGARHTGCRTPPAHRVSDPAHGERHVHS